MTMNLQETRHNVDKWLTKFSADDPWNETMEAVRLHLMRLDQLSEKVAKARGARDAIERLADIAQNIIRA